MKVLGPKTYPVLNAFKVQIMIFTIRNVDFVYRSMFVVHHENKREDNLKLLGCF